MCWKKRLNAYITIRDNVCFRIIPFEMLGMFDAVLSFNAVHHFDLPAFLREATRVLRPCGRLVIYTRTPEQNRRTIWGRYLSGFAERETRLYGVETLRDAIRETNVLCDVRSLTLPWTVTTSLARLLQQARAFHYSTFRLYSLGEFDEALEVFANGVAGAFGASNIATHNDHQLVLARRQPGESIIVPRWPLEAVASLAPAGFQHQTGRSDDKGRSSRRRSKATFGHLGWRHAPAPEALSCGSNPRPGHPAGSRSDEQGSGAAVRGERCPGGSHKRGSR